MEEKFITIKNARVNNLKNINLRIPRNKLTIITGVSGSGKTSLAFDTIFAEGQRQYVESLSSYARQFLNRMEKPNVDYISGISPAIAVDQKRNTRNPRSTVGTATEIYDYLKLLFTKIGKTISPISGNIVKKHTETDVLKFFNTIPDHSKYYISFTKPIKVKNYKRELEILLQKGFSRIIEGSKIKNIEDILLAKPNNRIKILLDKGIVNSKDENFQFKIIDVAKNAFYEGRGQFSVIILNNKTKSFSNNFDLDNIRFFEPSIQFFSANNPYGACEICGGFGNILDVDENLIVPNKKLSVYGGAIVPWKTKKMGRWLNPLITNNNFIKFPIHKPYNQLSKKDKEILWSGTGTFKGINKFFNFLESKKHKIQYRVMAARYKGKTKCKECLGTGIRKEAAYVKIGKKSIHELLIMPISELVSFFNNHKFKNFEQKKIDRILKELFLRLQLIKNVGLEYLSLNRKANTLSGGEFQRIKLTSSLGSPLVGSLYILDEPTIGLHSYNTKQLIRILKNLRDIGNTVLVVEHDADVIKSSDYIIDIGPGAGFKGGSIVFNGDIATFNKNKTSLTSKFIKKTNLPYNKEPKKTVKKLKIVGAAENNLKNLTIHIPLGIFVVVTGVSGSGKSTLVKKILFSHLAKHFGKKCNEIGKCDYIGGDLDCIDNVEIVDQKPLGVSSRSNPATYTKVYEIIRKIFSEEKKAKNLNLKPSHFSFNIEGGRCSNCLGEGVKKIEMQFMADIILECEKCKGKRFNKTVLSVLYNNKNIFEILDLTIDEAILFFKDNQSIIKKLASLNEVGLGYLKLGQQTSSLSGGEAQRLKLASFLDQSLINKKSSCLFIFDEPTTGLHYYDIEKLLSSFNKLIDVGNSVICIEHNLEVIRQGDWIIDLGPGGGEGGGNICFQGTPKKLLMIKNNKTADFIKNKIV